VSRFIDHLSTRLGTTSNYSATATLHNYQITTALLSISSLACLHEPFPGTACNSEILQFHARRPSLHSLSCRTAYPVKMETKDSIPRRTDRLTDISDFDTHHMNPWWWRQGNTNTADRQRMLQYIQSRVSFGSCSICICFLNHSLLCRLREHPLLDYECNLRI
jgi:hypothetical protein